MNEKVIYLAAVITKVVEEQGLTLKQVKERMEWSSSYFINNSKLQKSEE